MSQPPLERVDLAYYLVMFVDVLGHGDRIARLRDLQLPKTPEDSQRYAGLLEDALSPVRYLRSNFEIFAKEMAAPDSAPDHIPQGAKALYLRAMNKQIITRGFSDSMLMSAKLVSDDVLGDLPVIATIQAVLVGAAAISSIGLARGLPLRGGLSFGLGTEYYPGEYFGPALVDAYLLERDVSRSPRIVVDPKVIDTIYSAAAVNSHASVQDVVERYRKGCLSLITDAPDGAKMIDFLSPSLVGVGGITAETVHEAHRVTVESWQKFKAAGDHKLAGRYYELLSYFGARLSQWPVTEEPKKESPAAGS